MAVGFTQLINDISSSIQGLLTDLSGKSKGVPSYYKDDAQYRAIQSQINPESWSKLVFPYTFAIIDLKDPRVGPGNPTGFDDFALPLAPQAIRQTEKFAVKIQATQGGTSVNHSGVGYKHLEISGTTGNAPFRGAGGVNTKTGEAIFAPKELKYKSGYEVFLHLRNWFRTYYEYKKVNKKDSENLRLVFKNYKDGEFLIVELLEFEMDRTATRSFLYDYKLSFQVLAHFQFDKPQSQIGAIEDLIDQALNKINVARGIFLKSPGILRQIESTYASAVLEPMRQTTLALKSLLNVPLVAADIGSRTIVNTVSTAGALALIAQETLNTATLGATGSSQTIADMEALLDKRLFGSKSTLKKTYAAVAEEIRQKGPAGMAKLGGLLTIMSVGNFPKSALAEVALEQKSVSSLPRSFYEDTIRDLERIKKNSEDFFNLGSTSYDTLFDRTLTLNAAATKTVTNEEYDVLFAFNEAISAIYILLSTTDLFKSSFDDRIQDMVKRFNGNIELFSNQAVKQIQLDAGVTLERLAQQHLGNSSRWGEIVEVNNLKPPYLSLDAAESRDGVLKPGDNVLIPIPIQNGFSQVPQGHANKLTVNMNELEKSLGVDLKVDSNFDLVLTASGDLELIAGAQNLAQGTILKLSYERGELIKYPTIGAGILPGKKFPSVADIKDGIVNSLMQDARIQRIDDLSLRREGPALSLTFNIKIKNVDIPVPVKIKL